MANLNIYYRIFETNSKSINSEDIQEYFLELEGLNDFEEDSYELTREKIENFIISDGLEKKFISKSKIEFKLMKRGEKDQSNFKELEEPYQSLKSNYDYDLYLNIIIDRDFYTKKKEEEDINEKKREKDINRELISNVSQISKELEEVQKRIKDIEQAPIEDENTSSEIYYRAILKRKNSLHTKIITKNIVDEKIGDQQQKSPTAFLLPNRMGINTKTFAGKETILKVYFLYSCPLRKSEKFGREIKEMVDFQKDYSCYKQWLSIYKLLKNNRNIELYFKQIKNTLYLEQNPYILHIRVDSILKDEKMYFIFCSKDEYYIEYDITKCIEEINSYDYPNLKLLIISSNNIDKIKELFKKIKKLKNVNKIYIERPNKVSKENKYQRENMENQFIQDLYSNLIKNETIIDAYNKSIKDKNTNKYISEDISQKLMIFFNIFDNKPIDEENVTNQKYILNYDLIEDYYYPTIGRKLEFLHSLNKNSDKIIIYGVKDIDKNCFIKNLGLSFLAKEIVDFVYFLEIYPFEMNQLKKLYKIDMILDEIYKIDIETKILLIIYFNDIINKENFKELKNEIKRQRISKNKNILIKYIYAFDIKQNWGLEREIGEFTDPLRLQNYIDFGIDEIKNFINFYTQNKNNELVIINKIYEEIKKLKKGEKKINKLKIDNIYLLLAYFNLFFNDKNLNYDLIIKKDEILQKLIKILTEDDLDLKKDIIKKIINKNKENKDIFIYLYILRFGIGLSFLKIIWNDSWEQKIKFIKNNLIGLIIIEKNEEEEVYRLNKSFREIIGEYFDRNYKKSKIKIILENYSLIFRKIVSQLDYDKILSFNASINNNFWFTKKITSKKLNEQYIFNEEIDSYNIYNIIKNIENYDELFPYIDDISITLPTILYFKNDLIHEDLIVKIFEEKFCEILKNKYNIPSNDNNLENIKYLKALIIRLGIFKCRATKKYEFLKESLEKANAETKRKYNELNYETIIELCLIRIYLEIIRGGKNIEDAKEDFEKYIKEIKDENDKKNFKIRYKALYIKCLNSFKRFTEFEKNLDANQKENYKKELNNLKYQITMYCARFKFYFFLQNPIIENHSEISEINSNFFLTQKLLTILPRNFQFEFKSFSKEDYKSPFLQIKNILFLYIDNKNLFDKSIGKDKSEKNIKILILGYSVDNEQNIIELYNRGIMNIIYISSNNLKSNQMCFFNILFFNFIHIFISILVSKENNISIMKAFKEAKGHFNKNFKYIMEIIGTDLIIPKIEIKMHNESDIFDVDYMEYENEEINNNDNNQYINDEYEYEDEINRVDNVYYKRNIFYEKKETTKEFCKKTNNKYIKMPGNESLNEENFKEFVNGGIYHISKFKELISKIKESEKKNNIFNVYSENNINIASDICKYFFMEKQYENGIYLVKMINTKGEFLKLSKSNSLENDPKYSKDLKYLKLVVLDKIKNQNIILDEDLIKIMNSNEKTHFIICSTKKENCVLNSHKFNDEIDNKSIIEEKYDERNINNFNDKYSITQSIINNININ